MKTVEKLWFFIKKSTSLFTATLHKLRILKVRHRNCLHSESVSPGNEMFFENKSRSS